MIVSVSAEVDTELTDAARHDAHEGGVVLGEAFIAELALLFGRAFGQSADYWLNLQRQYDLELAQIALGSRLDAVRVVVPAADESGVA